jgi:hypothetical protein
LHKSTKHGTNARAQEIEAEWIEAQKMRSPSVTIACLMGAVVVFAVDIALMREGFRDPHAIFYILGVVPTANLVMIALLAESLRVRRRGKGQPFWTGFVFAGGLAIAVTSSFVPLTFAAPAWLVLRAFWLVLGQSNYQRLLRPGVDLLCISLAYTFPQVLFAVLGGWLFRKYRLVIVRDEGASTVSPGQRCRTDEAR